MYIGLKANKNASWDVTTQILNSWGASTSIK